MTAEENAGEEGRVVELPAAPRVRLKEALEVSIVNPEIIMLRLTDRTRVLFVPITVTPYAFGAVD